MTAPSLKPAGSSGLLGKLMAALRGEFRSDVLEFAPEDLVFGGAECRVAGCERTARGRGLCQGHLQRWNNQGRPDLEQFAASTDPRWRRQQPNQRCRVPGCGYGSARGGMCGLHAQRWERAGRPDLDAWLAEPQPVKQPAAGATCRIPHCELWPQATSPFCQTHTNTWKVNGRPDIDEFADCFAAETPLASEVIRLDRLAPQLKLEMQYVLQRRHDDRQGKLTPDVVMRVVRALVDADVGSLLDHDEDAWHERTRLPINDTRSRGFLGYASPGDRRPGRGRRLGSRVPARCLADAPTRLRRRPHAAVRRDRRSRWLRDLAKRWVRWRLSTGLGLEAGGGRPVVVLTRFARFLADIGVERIDQIDRPVLERYLADLRGDSHQPNAAAAHIGLLNRFFAAIRQHRWDTALPADAMFFAEDYPKREERLPRALAEHVMAQLEDPDNLARFADPAHRLITSS